MNVPTIFCFINGPKDLGDVIVSALAEDGTFLAEHMSSSEWWAKHDIGLTSNWKHEAYKAHYPDGYELEWVDDARTHERLNCAYSKHIEDNGPPEEACAP